MSTISVLVVDDSMVVRRLVTTALEQDPAVRVVGAAANGQIALSKLEQLAPDVVTLDIEMPVMDGLTTLREIRKVRPALPVIMFSTLTERGGQATLEALAAGASDYVTKPSNTGAWADLMQPVRDQLLPRIKALHGARRPRPSIPAARPSLQRAVPAVPPAAARHGRRGGSTMPARRGVVDVVAVGCSTGGPEALTSVVRTLPASLPVPVVVVQHMPPLFTRLFADRLDRASQVTVCEVTDGQSLLPGYVYIAPGNRHLETVRSGQGVVARLHDGPPENFCRPAVDVLFRSVAGVYGASALAVVLTGMGSDGRRGCEILKQKGARVIVQDAATSVVWGMPGAVANAGLADVELPVGAISGAILEAVSAQRTSRTGTELR